MEHDNAKIDEAVLGLLWLTIHDEMYGTARAWKQFDWDAMDRLHKAGFIDDPVNKNKSVLLSSEGLAAAKAAFEKHFSKPSLPNAEASTKVNKPSPPR